jgi:hypothetical protein
LSYTRSSVRRTVALGDGPFIGQLYPTGPVCFSPRRKTTFMKSLIKSLLTLAALLLFSITTALAAMPRVAVFAQAGFPYYNSPSEILPKQIAADLNAAGVTADLLDTAALADPTRLNTERYNAVVLPYGNAYPDAAFANLKVFHQTGGCLILSGIPFTHAIAQDAQGKWNDLGNDSDRALFGPKGIGVGGFRPGPKGAVQVASADGLGLNSLKLDWGYGEDAQALDPATLPTEDTILPILAAGGQPLASLIVHQGDTFAGAVDVWTYTALHDDNTLKTYATEQLLTRGTVAALAQKGLLPAVKAQTALARLDKLPRPFIYTNLTLPTPARPYPTLQPKRSTPAQHLYVADARKLPHDEQLLLASLQGLVNRKQPRVYLIWEDNDQFWLDAMQAQGQTGKPILVANPLSLLKMFPSAYKGAVVADPKVYLSPCVAVDLAGLDDLVIATPALATRLGLPIKSDLRGKFKDDAAALRYVRTALLPRLNPYLSLCLDPPLLGSQVDDVIAAKGMAFWITGPKAQDQPGANETAELAEIEATFAKLPLDAVVRGFWWHGDGVGLDEGPGVSLGSRFGKITTVSDYVANYSVLSGVQILSLKQKPQPPAPKLDPTKVYLALTMSDGDNLCTWRGYFRSYFTDPLHGTFPVAYGMAPTLLDVAPTLAKWYYDHASPNTEFLCDVSGVGYMYPPDWAKTLKDRSAATRSFYDWTQNYMARMDMKTVRLMNVRTEDIAGVGRDLPGVAFLMPDYGTQGGDSYSHFTYTLPTGQPVFRAVSYGPGPERLAGEVRGSVGQTRPAFVNAFIWNWGSKLSDLKAMLDLLGPEYVAVTPTQLNALYREAHAVK